MITIESYDMKIIREFLKKKMPDDYVQEWDDQTCFNELINILNYES